MTRRIILFSFLLIGISIIEFGCNDDWKGVPCKEPIYRLLSVDTSALALYLGDQQAVIGLNEGDSIDIDQLWFTVDFNTQEMACHRFGGASNLAFATPPCPPPRLEHAFDSIKVYQLDNGNKDISDQMSFLRQALVGYDGKPEQRLEMYPPAEAEFRFRNTQIDAVMTRYRFDFHFSDSTTFTSVSPSIYIKTD